MSNHEATLPSHKIILGITGGIAAYKCADLVRRLKERGFDVRVVMTESAKAFVTPLTLQAVSGYPVHDDLFDPAMEASMGHIELAKWADYILIAPATANTIAKLSHGKGDNLLTTIVLATQAKVVIAPAMNQQMWANQSTKENVSSLKCKNFEVLGPASGEQACGDVGEGRMLEPLELAKRLEEFANQPRSLLGKHFIITAGPTVEPIDPVRYISNHSSGKMGYALAKAALAAGATVDLISGPVCIDPPVGVNLINVVSAAEMLDAVKARLSSCHIFIGCAAVADYTPIEVSSQKIKKNDEIMSLKLKRNPDILAWAAAQENRPFMVGFAAESQNLREFAQLKLKKKNLDMICANDISCKEVGFNSDKNCLLIIDSSGDEVELDTAQKTELSAKIINLIANKQK